MNQKIKRFLSLFLSLVMAMAALPAYAAPEPATDQSSTSVERSADSSKTQKSEENNDTITVEDSEVPYTISADAIDASTSDISAAMVGDDAEVDTSDPTIDVVEEELKSMKIQAADGSGEKVALTDEQIQTVLGMFAQYQDQWKANADVLGVQMPFYLQFNDSKEDGLGVLGEMLVLAGVSVDAVRSGDYSYDELTGMIMNFYYSDKLGVEYYGDAIREKRDDAMQAVKDSGAKTEYQKLLVLNDWLATVNTFDMSYIMNMDKETPAMAAEQPTKHEHYDDVYNTLYAVYEEQITKQFHDQIYAGVVASLRQQYYENAIKNIVYEQALKEMGTDKDNATDEQKNAANEQAEAFMTENKDAISEDAAGFVEKTFGEDAAKQLSDGADAFIKDAEENGVQVAEGVTMTVEQLTQNSMENDAILDLNDDGEPETTANQAIPIYADQAAQGLTTGVLNAWEGNHVGALAEGKSVCLGYSRAYSYLIQVMHPEIYGTNGANTDMSKASNWKEPKDLYYNSNNELDITKDYAVDLVRITFDTEVSMYGESQPDFNSDHFWNAVKVDGTWYYVDPCYTDCYSEVMARDRVETDGSMNHMYFMFSDTSAKSLYEGYYAELKTLYADVATDKTYEDAWFSRIKSNVSSDGTNMYYVYDSTDLISQLEDYNNSQGDPDSMTSMAEEEAEHKLVSHPITDNDSGDGDKDYTALIEFNYKENEDDDTTVARVYNPATKKMEQNDMLTELYAKHAEQADIYPSIAITSALYNGKLYFNLSNYVLSYELSTGKVAAVKQYDTVYGKRDKTIAFGAMSFNLVDRADNADFTFNNHPIAGICLKDDGKLYVSIATNLAYISGKDDGTRSTENDYTADSEQNGYGYAFEESNYNPDYSNYDTGYDDSMMEQFGYSKEINDNDEFMWVANLKGAQKMSDLADESIAYKKEACDHHYIHFDETYFTKDSDTGKWNTGECYVCTICGRAVEEPTEPNENANWGSTDTSYEEQKAKYDIEKAEYDEIVASAGHTYTAKDAKWTKNDDGTYSVSFQNLICSSVCDSKKNQLDCLVNDDTIQVALKEPVTAAAEVTGKDGACTDGIKLTYTATGTAEDHAFEVSTEVQQEPGKHTYEVTFNWTEDYKATAVFKCAACGHKSDEIAAEVTADEKQATCTENAVTEYTATATYDGETASDTKKVEHENTATGHNYEGKIQWSEDNKTATGVFTCSKCDDKQTTEAEITTNTVDPTCTEEGKTTAAAKAVLKDSEGKELATAEDTKVTATEPATGHDYKAAFTWTKDDATGDYKATVVFTCSKGDAKSDAIEAEVTKSEKQATCTENAATEYTATASYDGATATDTKKVEHENTATGHDYQGKIQWSEDNKTATGVFTCSKCDEKSEVEAEITEKTTAPTCTKKGNTVATATATLTDNNGDVLATATDSKTTATTQATGHDYQAAFTWTKDDATGDYKATAVFTCSKDDAKSDAIEAEVTKSEKQATCTENAATEYTATAAYDGATATDTKKVEHENTATGHDYKGEIQWAEDNKTATATFTCSKCEDKQTVDAVLTTDDKPATCTEDGSSTITATATLKDSNGAALATATDSKTVAIPATGHSYQAKFTWADDGTSATATLTCKNCGDVQTVEAVVAKDEQNSVAPTCTEAGKNVFQATLKDYDFTDSKEVTVPATGHDFDHGKCRRCGITQLPFTDVAEGDWYYDAVSYVYQNDLMRGTSTTTFEPNTRMNRAMMVQILYNKKGQPAVHSSTPAFKDVPKSQWYYNAVQWAYETGVTAGSGGGKFQPNEKVTREQFAQFLYNYVGKPAVSGKLDFPDANKTSGWAVDAMLWANQNNMINGKKMPDGSVLLDPLGATTRAEAASILRGFCIMQEKQ